MPTNSRNKRLKMWKENPYCFVCDEEIKCFNQASIEHIIPKSEGGSNKPYNLAVSHKKCNSIKSNIMYRDEWKLQLAIYREKKIRRKLIGFLKNYLHRLNSASTASAI